MLSRPISRLLLGCVLSASTVAGAPADAPAQPAGQVRQIRVVADKAPDCSTLKTIVESVTRGCRTNDEKAVAIYNFMQMAFYHRAYPTEPGGVCALKAINVYGWSLCGGLHATQSALWRELGWKWRFLGWPGHSTVEAFYDGQWHYLDVFLKAYTWKADPNAPGGRTIASQADIAENPDLILRDMVFDEARQVYFHKDDLLHADGRTNWQAQPFFVCTDEPRGVVSGSRQRSDAGSPTGWAAINFDDKDYSTDVNLSPGWALTLTWDKIEGAWYWHKQTEPPVHGCPPSPTSIDRDYRNSPSNGPVLEPYIAVGGNKRTYANGSLLFEPDLSNDAFLADLAGRENVKVADGRIAPAEPGKPASIIVALASPYVMSKASGHAPGAEAQVSVDGGKTFRPVDLADFGEAVKGAYAALVKLTFDKPLAALRLEAIVQCNRCALPYLSPGPNEITVAVADPKQLGSNRLAVTYVYHTGYRDKSYEEMVKAGEQIAVGRHATWSDRPTVVQKVFEAKDLPATFRIDVPTPKGKHPVYPRMVLLRREVLAPGEKPLAVPAGALEPKVGPDDLLATLPNPYHVGTEIRLAAKASSSQPAASAR